MVWRVDGSTRFHGAQAICVRRVAKGRLIHAVAAAVQRTESVALWPGTHGHGHLPVVDAHERTQCDRPVLMVLRPLGRDADARDVIVASRLRVSARSGRPFMSALRFERAYLNQGDSPWLATSSFEGVAAADDDETTARI